jgi:hypothetical protein
MGWTGMGRAEIARSFEQEVREVTEGKDLQPRARNGFKILSCFLG